jgi:hypothetical protein
MLSVVNGVVNVNITGKAIGTATVAGLFGLRPPPAA